MENSRYVPQKTKKELPYDSAIPFLGIYLKKNPSNLKILTPLFIAALFTTAKL